MPEEKIMDNSILPAMTYRVETWILTILRERKLAVAQRTIEGSLLNIVKRDKIQHEVIRSKTKVKEIIERVQCMRGQWAGLIARISNTRWAKITSQWTRREGRPVRGRPKRRWRDNIKEVGSSQWMRVAQHRSAWCELWRPSASSGMKA